MNLFVMEFLFLFWIEMKNENIKERVIKTANYEYSAGSNGSGIGNYADDVNKNISQLDNLLMDLKHERDTSLERGTY